MSIRSKPPEMPKLGRRQDQGDSKGFLASLLSKLGLGGASGGAAYPAATVGAGNPFLSGILASKVGITALVLAGAATAGGLGIAIYDNIGPLAPPDPSDVPGLEFQNQVAQKPRDAAASQPATNPNGVSGSLDKLNQANRGFMAGAPSANSQTNTVAASASPARSPGVPDNTNGPSSQTGGVSRPTMVAGPTLSGSNSTTSSGARMQSQGGLFSGIGNSFQQVFHPSAARSASLASASGAGVSSRAMVGGVGSRAMQQLGATNRVVTGALKAPTLTSASAGTTYDGARTGSASANAGGINSGGLGVGGSGVSASNGAMRPNAAAQPNQIPVPPAGPSGNVTPYQWAVNVAMGAMALALIAFMAMSFAKKHGHLALAKIAAGVATGAALVASVMGITILTAYGQSMQGMIWTGVGALFAGIAAYNWYNLAKNDDANAQDEALAKAKELSRRGMGSITTENVPPTQLEPIKLQPIPEEVASDPVDTGNNVDDPNWSGTGVGKQPRG